MKRVLAVIVALFVSAAASGQDMPAPQASQTTRSPEPAVSTPNPPQALPKRPTPHLAPPCRILRVI
jgi:hypothetical protein